MIAHDYKSIDTSPKPCLCQMALVGTLRALGFVLFVSCSYMTVFVAFSL